MQLKTSLFLCCVLLLLSCNNTPKIEGVTVYTMDSPSGKLSVFPYLFAGEGRALMSWTERVGDSLTILKYATLKEEIWSAAKTIVQDTNWFLNWADFPAIAENNGNLLTHILKKSSPGTYSYDVLLNVLLKDSTRWNTHIKLHSDTTLTEHGFATLLPYKDASFFATWLDGRNTMQGGEHEHHGAMSLRAAEVSATGKIQGETLLDARTCDCCQTTAAITKNGPVVVYRDRSEEEIRDISIVRLVKGTWTTPTTIHADNWKINGCPVNGPKAAVLDNTLAVAWFTAADKTPKVQLIFSPDGGEKFETAIVVVEQTTLGRVDLALLDHNTAVVSYMETVDDKTQLMAVKVNRSGLISKPIKITELDAARNSGFPQMELVNDKLLFAWTENKGEEAAIKMAYVEVKDL